MTMKKFMSGLKATALALSFAAVWVVPVTAAPEFMINKPQISSNVEQVQYRRGHGRHYNRGGHYRGGGHYNRGRHYRGGGNYNRARYYHGGPRYRHGGYYRNGYRGYRDYRPGYRWYNNAWYPAAAFVGGALVGSAINQPYYNQPYYGGTTYAAPAYGTNSAHVQWCYNRYRSYRASDNTFQPNNGPRQQCRSPY